MDELQSQSAPTTAAEASPAAVSVSGAGEPEGTPATTSQKTETATNGATAATSEPDVDALLSREEVLEKLLAHEKVRGLVEERADHKYKSVRKTDYERDVQRGIQDELARLQGQQYEEQIANVPDDDLDQLAEIGKLTKTQVTQLRQQRAQQTYANRLVHEVAVGFWDANQKQLREGLSDEEVKQIKFQQDDGSPRPLKEIVAERDKVIIAKAVAKAKDEWTKETLPALRMQVLAEQRSGEESPDTTPGRAGGIDSDDAFLAAYSRGESSDHARAMKIMGTLR